MRMQLKITWNVILDGALDGIHMLAGTDAGAIADSEDMGIDRLRRITPPHIQDNVSRLAPHARQRLQCCAGIGHLTIVVFHQNTAQFYDILGFLAEQADGLDVLNQALFTQIQHFLRRVSNLEQLSRDLVYPRIGGLRRKGNGHDQSIDVYVLQLALGFGVDLVKARKDLADCVISKLLCHPRLNAARKARTQAQSQCASSGSRERDPHAMILTANEGRVMNVQNPESGYHYNVMRRAIDLIDQGGENLSLEELARQMDMSPAHFQRLFSRWTGVSPKRYQQYLTLGHAKALLRNRFTTLETAHNVGLSGSGRLHDLFLKWESMSPGEYARRGDGLTIYWGWFESPFGAALVMGTEKGICGIAFGAETGEEAAMEDMLLRWPNSNFIEDPMHLRPWVLSAFGAANDRLTPTPLYLIGSPLQIKVWEALMHIPSGQVTTYSEIAVRVGSPQAVRAIGTAVGRNPVSWLIPCHRALRKSGGLGGYHWGLPVKRAMLAYEAAQAEA